MNAFVDLQDKPLSSFCDDNRTLAQVHPAFFLPQEDAARTALNAIPGPVAASEDSGSFGTMLRSHLGAVCTLLCNHGTSSKDTDSNPEDGAGPVDVEGPEELDTFELFGSHWDHDDSLVNNDDHYVTMEDDAEGRKARCKLCDYDARGDSSSEADDELPTTSPMPTDASDSNPESEEEHAGFTADGADGREAGSNLCAGGPSCQADDKMHTNSSMHTDASSPSPDLDDKMPADDESLADDDSLYSNPSTSPLEPLPLCREQPLRRHCKDDANQ